MFDVPCLEVLLKSTNVSHPLTVNTLIKLEKPNSV